MRARFTRAFTFHTISKPFTSLHLLDKTVFSFGAEFINFNALRPDATEEQEQALLDSFLVPTRTLRPHYPPRRETRLLTSGVGKASEYGIRAGGLYKVG